MNLTMSVIFFSVVSAQEPCENEAVKQARNVIDSVDIHLKSQQALKDAETMRYENMAKNLKDEISEYDEVQSPTAHRNAVNAYDEFIHKPEYIMYKEIIENIDQIR